jgi:hypothetical protein
MLIKAAHQKSFHMQPKKLRSIPLSICLFLLSFPVFYSCQKDSPGDEIPNTVYNFDLILHTQGKIGSELGLLKFRQNPDPAEIINLDTWVHHLKPNHDYSLQRAVNPIADVTGCSSIIWLTLGEGLTPQAIHTNANGDGFAPLWRDVSSAAKGTSFHIHFQIIDAVTLETVLVSDCHDYTVL